MTLNLSMPGQDELKPRITVFGVGGAGGNAVNNMIEKALTGVEFVVANTDAQALQQSQAPNRIQLGIKVTEGLGAGARASVGAAAAEESIEQIVDHLAGSHMCFITGGMGGGTGTGAAPIIAQAARELGVLTVGVVTKPFQFEGVKRMRQAEDGVDALQKVVDTLIIIPNQNLFRLANEKTTFTEAFSLADNVLYQGVKGISDLMVRPGLINLDFADVRSVMDEMGKAMMGTGEGEGEDRAVQAAERAIANPLLDEISLKGRQGRPDQHHRQPRLDPVRTGRGRQPDPRRSGPGGQYHRRLDPRYRYGRQDARQRRGHRHRCLRCAQRSSGRAPSVVATAETESLGRRRRCAGAAGTGNADRGRNLGRGTRFRPPSRSSLRRRPNPACSRVSKTSHRKTPHISTGARCTRSSMSRSRMTGCRRRPYRPEEPVFEPRAAMEAQESAEFVAPKAPAPRHPVARGAGPVACRGPQCAPRTATGHRAATATTGPRERSFRLQPPDRPDDRPRWRHPLGRGTARAPAATGCSVTTPPRTARRRGGSGSGSDRDSRLPEASGELISYTVSQ